jgi:hypothetical protein
MKGNPMQRNFGIGGPMKLKTKGSETTKGKVTRKYRETDPFESGESMQQSTKYRDGKKRFVTKQTTLNPSTGEYTKTKTVTKKDKPDYYKSKSKGIKKDKYGRNVQFKSTKKDDPNAYAATSEKVKGLKGNQERRKIVRTRTQLAKDAEKAGYKSEYSRPKSRNPRQRRK